MIFASRSSFSAVSLDISRLKILSRSFTLLRRSFLSSSSRRSSYCSVTSSATISLIRFPSASISLRRTFQTFESDVRITSPSLTSVLTDFSSIHLQSFSPLRIPIPVISLLMCCIRRLDRRILPSSEKKHTPSGSASRLSFTEPGLSLSRPARFTATRHSTSAAKITTITRATIIHGTSLRITAGKENLGSASLAHRLTSAMLCKMIKTAAARTTEHAA